MTSLSWDLVQETSEQILSDGLFKLKTQPFQMSNEIQNNSFGNYIISNNKISYYIGEGKEISNRIKQQFKPTTSTFYKTYLKNQVVSTLSIDTFKVQTISTEIGRKEIEEFGIPNLPTILNKFQLNKRKFYKIDDKNGLWNKVQNVKSALISEAEQEVFKCKFQNWFDCIIESNSGIYLVKNKLDNLIYVGESSDISERYNTHIKTTYFSALRRHIGTEILNYTLQEQNGKKRYFEDNQDKKITEFLKTCKAIFYPVQFGRYELEEYLIKKHKPILNRKDNKLN